MLKSITPSTHAQVDMWDVASMFTGSTYASTYDACTLAPPAMKTAMLDIVRNSHKMEVRFKVADGTGGFMSFCDAGWRTPTWRVVSGDVKESLDDEVTRTLSAEVVADYWTSTNDVLKDLSPYKTMIRVERGVYTPRGIVYIPLGVYRLFDISVQNGKNVTITAYSQEADLRDHRYITPPGVTASAMTFQTLLSASGMVFSDMAPTAPSMSWIGTAMNGAAGKLKILPTKTTLTTARNRLELAERLVQSLGGDFFFTRSGYLVARDRPAFTDTVQLRVNATRSGMGTAATASSPAILVSFDKKYSRNNVYNAVVATGTDTAGVVSYRGTAYDTAPTSPTRWGGPFGKKPRFYASPFLKTNAQCTAMAQRLLAESNRLKSSLDFSFVPNPMVEVGDLIELEYPDGSVEKHIIRVLSIPLTANGSMTSSTAADSDTQAEMSVM